MRKILISIIFASMFIITGCNNSQKEEAKSSDEPTVEFREEEE